MQERNFDGWLASTGLGIVEEKLTLINEKTGMDKYIEETGFGLIEEAFTVEEFDEVVKKVSKKLFRVVEIIVKDSTRVFMLRPLDGKAKASDEFSVDNQKFFKEYQAA